MNARTPGKTKQWLLLETTAQICIEIISTEISNAVVILSAKATCLINTVVNKGFRKKDIISSSNYFFLLKH